MQCRYWLIFKRGDVMLEVSRVNPSWNFDEQNWLVSLVDIQDPHCCNFHGHAQIVIEGQEAGKTFVRRYDIIRGGKTYYSSDFQRLVGNEEGTIGEIREFIGYSAKSYKELSSKQWSAPSEAVKMMIASILEEKRALEIAKAEGKASILFKYQNAGSGRWTWLLGGNGGENCITWAEKHLATIKIGNGMKVLDFKKASPVVHIRYSDLLKYGGAFLGTASVALLYVLKR